MNGAAPTGPAGLYSPPHCKCAPGGARFKCAILAMAALAAALLAPAPNAAAQDQGEELRRCMGGDETIAPQARVDSCTASIASGANTPRAVSRLLMYRGAAWHRSGDTRQALAYLNEAIRLDPEGCCEVYDARGRLLALMGEGRAAVEDFDRSVRRTRDPAAIHDQRCRGRAIAGVDLDRARRFCDAAVRMRPGAGAFLDSRGLVGLKQGRYDDAWNDYNAALRWAPDDAEYLYGRGIAALRHERAADGEADIAAALKSNPAIADIYCGYGITR